MIPRTNLLRHQLERSWRPTRTLATVRSAPAEAGSGDPTTYCRNLVRKHDYDSFLIAQFWPKELQRGYYALKAFAVELATVQDVVSNTVLGQMRMQFWRDAVKSISDGRPPRHPVALALYETSQTAHLPAYHLKRIIDARDAELSTPTHLSLDSLTSHAESTSSTLLYLLLSLLNLNSSELSHAASHLGAAQTITTLLRALPFHAAQRRMVIPAELTARRGVVQEDVFRNGGKAKGLEDAVYDFAVEAHAQLSAARDMAGTEGGKVPRVAMPVFLAGVPVASFLGRLEAANFDAYKPGLQQRGWNLPWQVWRSYYKSTF
ncbi:hypothetical protein PLICRDRAFT_43724 [Plicaturopsis crispa FD-325 SS-3]|nr:hypothetical protein PLICRDRAFT_43724 [Plicaturopsis crispa FD-325 SS-3]